MRQKNSQHVWVRFGQSHKIGRSDWAMLQKNILGASIFLRDLKEVMRDPCSNLQLYLSRNDLLNHIYILKYQQSKVSYG